MNLSELHYWGGAIWMFPIDLLGIINLALIVFLVYSQLTKKSVADKPLQTLRHIGGLALAWGAFATLAGFFQALGALEEMKEMIPFQVICGGLKVALITVLYGLLVYMISLMVYIILKVRQPVKA